MNRATIWFALVIAVGTAMGDILGISGNIVVIDPPPSVVNGVLEDDDFAKIFIERNEFAIGQEIFVDVSEPGTVAPTEPDVYPPGSLSPSDVPPGTLVESVYVHADPASSQSSYSGRIDFDREVIGIIIRTQTLLDTDGVVGAPGTTYGPERRLGGSDSVTITGGRTSILFSFQTSTGIDQIRVLVSADPPCNAADLSPIFGRLDLADINTFVTLFLAGDPGGDLNGDGLFDLQDVLAFSAAFLAGCP